MDGKGKPRTTFQGINISNARKIVEYEFSECLIKLDQNHTTQTYEVYITDGIDKKSVEKFKTYWGNNFLVKVYSFKYQI